MLILKDVLISAASFQTRLRISKTDVCECGEVTSVLLCIPLYSFAPITPPWQLRKMRINPWKLVGDTEWPGAALCHLCSLKPDNLIWRRRFLKLSHGSVVSQSLGLSLLPPPPSPPSFALMVSVDGWGGGWGDWENSQTCPTLTNKEITAGNKAESSSSGWCLLWDWMLHGGLLLLKETISHNMCCGYNIPLTSSGAGMS